MVKRASIEPNFHNLYLAFLHKVNVPGLIKSVQQQTYGNIRVLLQSEKVLTQVRPPRPTAATPYGESLLQL